MFTVERTRCAVPSLLALLAISFAYAFVFVATARAQFGREGTWMTSGGNAQRSSWVRADGKITKSAIASGFQLLWKAKLDSNGSELTQPLIMDRYIGYQGFRSFALLGGRDAIYAVDTDLNRIEWQRRLSSDSERNVSSTCSADNVASVALPTTAEFSSGLPAFGAFGRGGSAKSGVGEAYQGAVTLAAAPVVRPFPVPAGGFPRTKNPIVLHALSSDGMFHTMWLGNGFEPEPPMKFVPANGAARGLIVVNKIAYAVTGENCGATGGVWALDLNTKQVASWTGDGAKIAGSEGAAIGPDGTLYVATTAGDSPYSSSVVALEPRTLKPKEWYTAPGEEFTSSPVIFQYRNKVLAAAVTKDGRLHLLSTASLGGTDHKTAVFVTRPSSNRKDFIAGALASWQDTEFTVWLLASTGTGKDTNGTVVAWKIVDQNGAPAVKPGWISRDMNSLAPPTIINGVVFALSTGRGASAQRSSSAVLYALDGTTGKELWNSGKAITSPVEARGVAGGGGQMYVTARDGILYAFGFPMEH